MIGWKWICSFFTEFARDSFSLTLELSAVLLAEMLLVLHFPDTFMLGKSFLGMNESIVVRALHCTFFIACLGSFPTEDDNGLLGEKLDGAFAAGCWDTTISLSSGTEETISVSDNLAMAKIGTK